MKRPVSSLVLFSKEGESIWSAPQNWWQIEGFESMRLAALFMEEVSPMGFMKTKRSDGFEGHRRSFITVTESHFHLNAKFMREADL